MEHTSFHSRHQEFAVVVDARLSERTREEESLVAVAARSAAALLPARGVAAGWPPPVITTTSGTACTVEVRAVVAENGQRRDHPAQVGKARRSSSSTVGRLDHPPCGEDSRARGRDQDTTGLKWVPPIGPNISVIANTPAAFLAGCGLRDWGCSVSDVGECRPAPDIRSFRSRSDGGRPAPRLGGRC